MKRNYQCLLAPVALAFVLTGCGKSSLEKKAWSKIEVEIAPDHFEDVKIRGVSSDDKLPSVSFRDLHVFGSRYGRKYTETIEIEIPNEHGALHWKGHSIPYNLRLYQGRFYLITFDRVTNGTEKAFFRYFEQDGNSMKEIEPLQFPKAVAGQNMGFGDRYFMGLDERRDNVQIARDLDPSDPYFRNSLTAKIWHHLATGEQYWYGQMRGPITEKELAGFISENHPIKLTAIVRSETELPADRSPHSNRQP